MSELMGDYEIMIQCVTVETTCIIPFCKAIKHDFMPYIQRLSVFKFYTHIREPYLHKLSTYCIIIDFLPFLYFYNILQNRRVQLINKGCLTLEISEIMSL